MGSEQLKAISLDAATFKEMLLEGKNIDILLYLAKYNPDVPKSEILKAFGKESGKGLEDLKDAKLVMEKSSGISLTNEGIFQVDGLLAIAV